MREIKFRAWVVDEYKEDGNTPRTFKMHGWDKWFFSDMSAVTSFSGEFPSMIDPCVSLMQFTGLHDKSGKEIYEGDILKLQYPINYGFGGTHNKEITVTISFDNGSFWFAGEGYTDCNWHFYNKYEVIGNIYENPELIK